MAGLDKHVSAAWFARICVLLLGIALVTLGRLVSCTTERTLSSPSSNSSRLGEAPNRATLTTLTRAHKHTHGHTGTRVQAHVHSLTHGGDTNGAHTRTHGGSFKGAFVAFDDFNSNGSTAHCGAFFLWQFFSSLSHRVQSTHALRVPKVGLQELYETHHATTFTKRSRTRAHAGSLSHWARRRRN